MAARNSSRKVSNKRSSKRSSKSSTSKRSSRHSKSKEIHLVDEIAHDIEGKMFTKTAEPFSIISSYKIKNILDDEELYDKSLKLCANKMVRKSQIKYDESKNMDIKPEKLITNKKAEDICKCLLRKNSEITLRELETLTRNKEPTPGSKCLELL